MCFINCHAAKATLPEVPRLLLPRMDQTGIATMQRRRGAAQPIRISRNKHEMNMVGHQTPSPDGHIRLAAAFAHQRGVGRIIGVGKKHPLPPVPALGDVMGQKWNDNTSEAGHREMIAGKAEVVDLVHCHRNSDLVRRITLA